VKNGPPWGPKHTLPPQLALVNPSFQFPFAFEAPGAPLFPLVLLDGDPWGVFPLGQVLHCGLNSKRIWFPSSHLFFCGAPRPPRGSLLIFGKPAGFWHRAFCRLTGPFLSRSLISPVPSFFSWPGHTSPFLPLQVDCEDFFLFPGLFSSHPRPHDRRKKFGMLSFGHVSKESF